MFEKRLPIPKQDTDQIPIKNLPKDYTDLVAKTFEDHFRSKIQKTNLKIQVSSQGIISVNEIGLTVSFYVSNELKSISFHASSNYDPKASTPKVEALLAQCLDILGDLVKASLKKNSLETLLSEYASATLEELPLEWSPTDAKKQSLFVKIDRLHPELEDAADKIIRDHDEEIH